MILGVPQKSRIYIGAIGKLEAVLYMIAIGPHFHVTIMSLLIFGRPLYTRMALLGPPPLLLNAKEY